MGKVVTFTNVTLDGVMQAPGRPDEDMRDHFQLGGWAAPYAAMSDAGDRIASIGALLLGRRTYEDFADFWPKQPNNPMTEMLNQLQKYVVSTTLREPLSWQNSTLLAGDLTAAVQSLKNSVDGDIVIFGSGVLIQSLAERQLIDEYILLVHPLVLGSGRRLFPDGAPYMALELASGQTTTKGVTVATYRPTQSSP